MKNKIGPKRKKFFTSLRPYMSEDEVDEVQAAYEFSKYGHKKQKRDGGSRYFDHPRAVATILFEELKIYHLKMIVAALLHDLLEDSFLLTEKRIRINFGRKTSLWVKYLTKEKGMKFKTYYDRLRIASWEVIVIKLCDRLHNLRTLDNCSKAKQKRQIAETRKYYIPLADQLIDMLPKKKKHIGEYLKEKITQLCDQHPA